MIAASLLLATAAITHFERDTWSANLPEPVDIHVASAGEWQAIEREVPVAFTGRIKGGTLRVRAKTKVVKEEWDDHAFRIEPQLALEIDRNGKSERYIVPIDDWGYSTCHKALKTEMPVEAFGRLHSDVAGVVVSTFESDCGAHSDSEAENIFAIDVTQKQPRAAHIVTDDIDMWGYANGGVYRRDGKIGCSWQVSDFTCVQTEKIDTPVGDFAESRRFTLFGGKALRVEGARSLAEAAASESEQPALVDGIGPFIPVTRIGNARLYATLETVDALLPTFYLSRDGRFVSATPEDLGDEFRDPPAGPEEEADAIAMTRTNNVAKFRAKEIAHTADANLLQVVVESGEARSLFWIAVDAEKLKFAALRVASTARERESRGRVVPGSIVSYKAIDERQFAVTAYGPWIDDVFDGASCEEEQDDDCDVFKGVIEWSPDGFSMKFDEQPQDLKAPQVTIAPDGTLGIAPREHNGQ